MTIVKGDEQYKGFDPSAIPRGAVLSEKYARDLPGMVIPLEDSDAPLDRLFDLLAPESDHAAAAYWRALNSKIQGAIRLRVAHFLLKQAHSALLEEMKDPLRPESGASVDLVLPGGAKVVVVVSVHPYTPPEGTKPGVYTVSGYGSMHESFVAGERGPQRHQTVNHIDRGRLVEPMAIFVDLSSVSLMNHAHLVGDDLLGSTWSQASIVMASNLFWVTTIQIIDTTEPAARMRVPAEDEEEAEAK